MERENGTFWNASLTATERIAGWGWSVHVVWNCNSGQGFNCQNNNCLFWREIKFLWNYRKRSYWPFLYQRHIICVGQTSANMCSSPGCECCSSASSIKTGRETSFLDGHKSDYASGRTIFVNASLRRITQASSTTLIIRLVPVLILDELQDAKPDELHMFAKVRPTQTMHMKTAIHTVQFENRALPKFQWQPIYHQVITNSCR